MLAIAVWTCDLDSLHTINKSFVFLNFKPATLLIHNRRIHFFIFYSGNPSHKNPPRSHRSVLHGFRDSVFLMVQFQESIQQIGKDNKLIFWIIWVTPTNSSQSDSVQVKTPILEKQHQQQLPKLKELWSGPQVKDSFSYELRCTLVCFSLYYSRCLLGNFSSPINLCRRFSYQRLMGPLKIVKLKILL